MSGHASNTICRRLGSLAVIDGEGLIFKSTDGRVSGRFAETECVCMRTVTGTN